jgi:YD repeat-containing protein
MNTYATKFEWTLYIDQGAQPEEYITSYTHDVYGNLTSITDTETHTKTYSYSAQYQHAYMTSITDALGNTLSVLYEFETGLVSSITTPNGTTSTYQYDLLKRVTKKVNPDLTEKEIVYDDINNCVTIFDELDHFVKKYYDGLNRLEMVEWVNNGLSYAVETYTYDYMNNLATRTDPAGHIYMYEYDSRGRTTRMINPDMTFKAIEYDDTHAEVMYTDENGHSREYQYDWVQRLKAVKEYTDPVNFYLTQYEYNQAGNLTQVINAHGEPVILEYGSLFGPTKISYPDGTTRSYTYDSRGNILTRTDGNKTTFYTYDAAYRQIQIQYPDQTVQFTYDPNGNRLSVTNDYSTKTYSYNNRNNLVAMTQQIDGADYTIAYTYDASGKLTTLTYPDGTVITQVYDDLNRLTSIDNYAEFTYSKDSLPETLTYTNGVVTTYTYDQCHRPVTITAEKNGVDLMNLEYNYDSVGNLLQLTTT